MRWRTGALIAAAAVVCGLSLETAAYAQSSADIIVRLRRLERDIRDLQAETFRRSPDGAPAGASTPAPLPEPEPAAEPPQPVPDLGPVMRRVDELEASVTRLTGQMEELGHKLDQLVLQSERMQKQMEFEAKQRADAQVARAAPSAASDQTASLAPNAPLPGVAPPPSSPGVLGQIPAGTTLPAPSAAADPRRDFDAAMNLLSRAQYDDAGLAFRKFVDTHPADERASAALYWTGDIAFSAKKDYEAAARDFAELLKKFPDAPRAPDSMLKLGLSLFQLGQKNEGCAALAALPAKYPQASPAIATRARNERRDAMCG